MAAYTSSQSGNWNSASTWGGAGIPGSGDTATIANGHTVTVPGGYTAICGTSPTNDSGTVALTTAGSGGTGILVVNGTFQWQGPVRQGNATWTFNAGSICTYDASGAATPSTALYSWKISDGSSQANAQLLFSGSSGSHVTVNSVGNVNSGGFGNTGTNWTDGGRVQATYTDFSYQGAASSSGLMLQTNASSSAASILFTNCTFDHCAQVSMAVLGAAASFDYRYNKVTNPANTSYTLQITGTTAKTTGTRRIENNDHQGRIYILCSGAVNCGFSIKNNVQRGTTLTAAGQSPIVITSGGSCSVYDQNFAFLVDGTHSADYSVIVPSGISATNCGLLVLVDPGYSNAHPIGGSCAGGDVTYSGWVLQYTGTDTNSDFFGVSVEPSSTSHNYKIANCVFLPNAAGLAVGSFLNNSSGSNQQYTKIYFEHNTAAAGLTAGGNAVFGVGCEASTQWPAGAVPSIQSNLLWRGASGVELIANSSSSATITAGAVTTADYNNAFNISGSIYGVPSNQFASTPGAHDLAVDPQFVDSTRSFLNFDQGYLGRSVATGWVTSHAYNAGDLASNSASAFFGGATYNYRCVTAHTSDGTITEPGLGSSWQQYWEPATVNEISTSILSGATFSGGTNSLIGEMVSWIKSGFAPRNAALHNAGHDGADIGAVAYQASSSGFGSLMLLGVGN